MPAGGEERSFQSMGSPSSLFVAGGGGGLATLAMERLRALERRWTRFDPGSEVSRLNREAGSWQAVSRDTYLLLERADAAHQWTGGLFAPLMLRELVALGYDRDFRQVALGSRPTRPATQDTLPTGVGVPQGADRMIELDARRRRVRIPRGTAFDPGGIGKGLAADVVCTELMEAGADGVLVNLGGDLRAIGECASSDGWMVAARHPPDDREVLCVRILDGGLATSSPASRRWTDGRAEAHHLLDPRTGAPGVGLPAAVSVLAATAWQAEVLCTAALLSGGTDEAVALTRRAGAHIAVTSRVGSTRSTLQVPRA